MSFAETAQLVARLEFKDAFSGPLKKASGALTKFGVQTGKVSQGFKTLGAGVGVAFVNGLKLAAVGVGALTTLVARSIAEGQEAAKVQTIYANAIMNSGRVSAEYVGILNKQQTALMNLAGVDDELIKTEQTRLIQMGLTGEQVAKITPLILDFSKATGVDLLTATKLAGKAVNGNTGALSRYGVMIDKAKAKVDPFAATVDALNKRFGGTTQALSGSLEARLGAFRENMANIREELGIKLLPAITRIVDVAGKDLVPAFGKFVDRIMPSLLSGIEQFASMLENGGAERGIKGITDALAPMIELLKIAAAPVKAIVGAFLSLPAQVQGILIGGFAINKLSGGLIGKGLGQIAGGVAGGLLQRGSSPANPLFVSAVGGLGGLGGAGAAGATSAWAKVGTVIGGAFAIVAVAQLADMVHSAISPGGGLPGRTASGDLLPADKLQWPFGPKNTPRWVIDGPFGPINLLGGDSDIPGGNRVGKLSKTPRLPLTSATHPLLMIEAANARGRAAGFKPTNAAGAATVNRNLERIAAANVAATDKVRMAVGDTRSELSGIRMAVATAQKPPNVAVTVINNIGAAQVVKSVVVQKRFGPPGGSRERGSTEFDV